MTRKDYIAIAEALRFALEYAAASPVTITRRAVETPRSDVALTAAEYIANAMQDDNPRFDREHFLAVVRGEKELTSRPPRHARSYSRRAVLRRERTGGHELVNGVCSKCDAGDPTSIFALSDTCTG